MKLFSKILRKLALKLNFFENSFFGVTLRKQVWRPLKWAKNGPLTFFPNSHLPEENFEGSWAPLGGKMTKLQPFKANQEIFFFQTLDNMNDLAFLALKSSFFNIFEVCKRLKVITYFGEVGETLRNQYCLAKF